jgi:hypothetical protein
MNRRWIVFPLALALCAAALSAQEKQPRKSPHDKASIVLDGNTITIEYGRPYLHGRKAVGGTLVPFGQVWRLGADEATKLTTPVALRIGNLTVPAGSYALFTMATETGWTLIVNKTADQWGAFTYDQAQDLGRVPMHVSKTEGPVEQFTIAFTKAGDKKATLMLSWENTMATVDLRAG